MTVGAAKSRSNVVRMIKMIENYFNGCLTVLYVPKRNRNDFLENKFEILNFRLQPEVLICTSGGSGSRFDHTLCTSKESSSDREYEFLVSTSCERNLRFELPVYRN